MSQAAHDNNVSQSQMDAIISAYLKGQNTYLSQYAFDPEAEMAKINVDSTKAGYVVEGVRAYMSRLELNDGQQGALTQVMASGDGVALMSKIMSLAGVKAIPVGSHVSVTPDTTALKEEWDSLRKNPALRDNDSAAQARFEEIGSKLNG